MTQIEADLAALTPLVVLTQTYDALSNRTSLATTIGGTADFKNEYLYDNLSRLKRVTQAGVSGGNAVAQKRVDFTYDAASQWDTITRYSDLAGTSTVATSDYTFDNLGRMTALTHARGGTTFANYGWTYDLGDRITAFTNSIYSAENATYSYDNTDQLTGADRSGSSNDEAYAYDDNGNHDTANGDAYTTGTNNQLLSDGTYDYEYDDEGNRLSKENIATGEREEYTWDHRNRLTQVTFKNSGGTITKTVQYTYDYQNRWISKVLDPDGATGSAALEERNYVYDGDQIVAEFAGDAAADLGHRYLWGTAIDQVLADEDVSSLGSAGTILWPLTDNLGTVRDLVNSSGALQNHIAYDSFGNILSETNSAVDHLIGFTGRPYDESTKLQNNVNRWYDSKIGQWISEDPIGFGGGDGNLSRYVKNSVTVSIDPRGLQSTLPDLWQNDWDEQWDDVRDEIDSIDDRIKEYFDELLKDAKIYIRVQGMESCLVATYNISSGTFEAEGGVSIFTEGDTTWYWNKETGLKLRIREPIPCSQWTDPYMDQLWLTVYFDQYNAQVGAGTVLRPPLELPIAPIDISAGIRFPYNGDDPQFFFDISPIQITW